MRSTNTRPVRPGALVTWVVVTPAAARRARSAWPSGSALTAAARPTRRPRAASASATLTAAPPGRRRRLSAASNAVPAGAKRSHIASPTQSTSSGGGASVAVARPRFTADPRSTVRLRVVVVVVAREVLVVGERAELPGALVAERLDHRAGEL